MTDSTASPASALPQRLERGTAVGRYEIDGWLRDGGMASLYRGHHAKTGAKVAIKVQLGRGAEEHVTAARFEREGQVMGRLSGVPNVAQVHDVGELPDGRRYLVMEWIEGDNLEELLDDLRNADRRLDIERACRLMKDVALALVAVHRAEVVHRDLKPSNIMIDHRHPDREVAKLLDFGISADLGKGHGSADLTAAGVVLGTSGYVAPEQALGLPAHPSFDVYAFGVVLFEALTGHGPPPEGLVPERLPPITTMRAGVPAELAELVIACLHRDPSKRPPNAEALVERLDGVIRGLRRSASNGAHASTAAATEGADARSSRQPAASPEQNPAEAKRDEARPREDAGTRGRRPRAAVATVVGIIAVVVIGGAVLRCGSLGPGDSEGKVVGIDGGKPAALPAADAVPADPTPIGDSTSPVEAVDGTSGSRTTTPSSTGAPEPGPSSTDDGPTPPSSGEGGTASGPKGPHEGVMSEACKAARRRAASAAEVRDWTAVLRATAERRCWDAPEHRNERKALRVAALAELGRYEECVAEGAGSTDPRVARRTKLCRVRTEEKPR